MDELEKLEAKARMENSRSFKVGDKIVWHPRPNEMPSWGVEVLKVHHNGYLTVGHPARRSGEEMVHPVDCHHYSTLPSILWT